MLWFDLRIMVSVIYTHAPPISKIPTLPKPGNYQIIIQNTFLLCRHVWGQILVTAELPTNPFKVPHHLMAVIFSEYTLDGAWMRGQSNLKLSSFCPGLQFLCKYTGVLVPHKWLCPRCTLGFVFISLRTVLSKSHSLTDVINMTDAFNFQAEGEVGERVGERNVSISKSNWSLPTFLHKHRPRGHFATLDWSPSVLFDSASVNLRKILFRHNEDVLDTSEGGWWGGVRLEGEEGKKEKDGWRVRVGRLEGKQQTWRSDDANSGACFCTAKRHVLNFRPQLQWFLYLGIRLHSNIISTCILEMWFGCNCSSCLYWLSNDPYLTSFWIIQKCIFTFSWFNIRQIKIFQSDGVFTVTFPRTAFPCSAAVQG